MAETKRLKTRFVQKHDIEANWIKATSFIPLQGEVIIYDAETTSTSLEGTGRTTPITYQRIKVGDGITTVTNLQFVGGDKDWSQNDSTKPDYIKNRTHYEDSNGNVVKQLDTKYIPVDNTTVVSENGNLKAVPYTLDIADGKIKLLRGGNEVDAVEGIATEQFVGNTLSDYAKKTDIPDVSEFISEIPAEYVTDNELTNKGYATETFVTEEIAKAVSGGEVDLSGYATKEYVDDKMPLIYTGVVNLSYTDAGKYYYGNFGDIPSWYYYGPGFGVPQIGSYRLTIIDDGTTWVGDFDITPELRNQFIENNYGEFDIVLKSSDGEITVQYDGSASWGVFLVSTIQFSNTATLSLNGNTYYTPKAGNNYITIERHGEISLDIDDVKDTIRKSILKDYEVDTRRWDATSISTFDETSDIPSDSIPVITAIQGDPYWASWGMTTYPVYNIRIFENKRFIARGFGANGTDSATTYPLYISFVHVTDDCAKTRLELDLTEVPNASSHEKLNVMFSPHFMFESGIKPDVLTGYRYVFDFEWSTILQKWAVKVFTDYDYVIEVPGCSSCDTCQSCDSCEGCLSCDSCESCQSSDSCSCDGCMCSDCGGCQSCEGCLSCEGCDSCQSSEGCSCVSCQSCDSCDTCQSCDSCDSCDSCQSCLGSEGCTCDSCQTCDGCESCQSCDSCEGCLSSDGCSCDTCQCSDSGNSCDGCQCSDSCSTCLGSEGCSCDTCQCSDSCSTCQCSDSCSTCQCSDGCGDCQGCMSCEDCESCQGSDCSCDSCLCSDNCGSCQSCESCDSCQSSDGCSGCGDCETCMSSDGCSCDGCMCSDGCSGCQSCDSCEGCEGCQGCQGCDSCESCQSSDGCSCDSCQCSDSSACGEFQNCQNCMCSDASNGG